MVAVLYQLSVAKSSEKANGSRTLFDQRQGDTEEAQLVVSNFPEMQLS